MHFFTSHCALIPLIWILQRYIRTSMTCTWHSRFVFCISRQIIAINQFYSSSNAIEGQRLRMGWPRRAKQRQADGTHGNHGHDERLPQGSHSICHRESKTLVKPLHPAYGGHTLSTWGFLGV